MLLPIPQVVKRHGRNVVERTPVTVAIQNSATRLSSRGRCTTAENSTKQAAQTAGVDALLTLLPSEICHHDRSEHHQDLSHLPALQSALLARLLHDLSLASAQNVTQNAARVSL